VFSSVSNHAAHRLFTVRARNIIPPDAAKRYSQTPHTDIDQHMNGSYYSILVQVLSAMDT
jgi:hypothetical protein